MCRETVSRASEIRVMVPPTGALAHLDPAGDDMDATMWLDSMALAGFVLWCIGSLTMVGGWIVLAWTHGPHRPAHAPVRVPPVR